MSATKDSRGRRLVVIDVGNTNTVLGLFKDGKLVDHFRLSTESERTEDEYSALMLPLLNRVGLDPAELGALTRAWSRAMITAEFSLR